MMYMDVSSSLVPAIACPYLEKYIVYSYHVQVSQQPSKVGTFERKEKEAHKSPNKVYSLCNSTSSRY